MKTTALFRVLTALLLVHIATVMPASGEPAKAEPAPAGADKGAVLAALEKKLLGTWHGGPCIGDYTFNADGTYTLRRFTPGGNTLTGTWSLRWDALPPTLVVTCKTSDFKARDANRREYEYFGKALEIKVEGLNDDELVLRFHADKEAGFQADYTEKYRRRAEK